MAWYELLGILAGLVSLAGFLPYARDIIARTTVPSRSSWFIWTIVGGMLCATYREGGARETVWVAASYVVGPLLVFLLSLRFGTGGWSPLDRACLVLAAVSAVLWITTNRPLLALGLNIGIDLLGAVPTIRKAFREPWSESRTAWHIFLAGAVLNLVAAQDWSPGPISYPLYLFGVSCVMTILLRRERASGR